MKKSYILFILFFVQFCFGQGSGFSFRVNSITEFYDSQSSIYIRRYQGSEISLKLNLTNEELILINDFFDKIKFYDLPDKFSCDEKISVLPNVSYDILLRKNGLNKESINSNCIKNDNEKERKFEKLWSFIFSILNNKEVIKKMKNSDIELI
jgi:hypothetical protein